MKSKTKTVYYCEYCRRHMLSASAMSVHERFCPQRPHNRHQCFQWCKHLKMTTDVIDRSFAGKTFQCARIGCKLYSYKYERHMFFHGDKLRPGTLRMPLTCPHYVDAEMEIREQRERERENVDVE